MRFFNSDNKILQFKNNIHFLLHIWMTYIRRLQKNEIKEDKLVTLVQNQRTGGVRGGGGKEIWRKKNAINI